MKSHIKNIAVLLGAVTAVAVLIWLTTSRMSFMTIWVGMIFIVGLPIFWDKYGKDAVVLTFWTNIAKNAGRIIASLLVYFLIRAYIAYLVDFAPFESFVIFRQNSGMVSFLGMTPPQVLFECTFVILVGMTVLRAVYKKEKPARVRVGVFLGICLLGQMFVFWSGPAATNAALTPISNYNRVNLMQKNGALGGTVKGIWQLLFGGEAEASGSMMEIRSRVLTQGKYGYIVENGSSSIWFESATAYDITSPNMEFDIVTVDGRIIPSFQKDKWPINEPFQIMAITTRQNLEITVL